MTAHLCPDCRCPASTLHGGLAYLDNLAATSTNPALLRAVDEVRAELAADFPQSDLTEAYRELDRIVTSFMLGDVDGAAVAEVQQRFRFPA